MRSICQIEAIDGSIDYSSSYGSLDAFMVVTQVDHPENTSLHVLKAFWAEEELVDPAPSYTVCVVV